MLRRAAWMGLWCIAIAIALTAFGQRTALAADQPNIIMIMGDDIGWANVGVYNQGIMAGRTPNIDRLAAEGTRFTDYYAEASCTAGRANFITGELPIRTGLTTVGQAGSPVGIPDEAVTIAAALKASGYTTGQFGKNHLGDLNKFLPTAHGFDEFFGYLYHLDAMEDPCHVNYPPSMKDTVGPRHMVHSFATNKDDGTDQPRWGKVGKQRIEDKGELCPKRMETVDDEILEATMKFMEKAKKEGRPFFVWLNPTRMHVITHLSPKYQGMRNSENNWGEEEAGMAQLDDIVGSVTKFLKDSGLENNTIVGFTTDNGAENFTFPDGGQTPFAGGKGTALEGGFRAPMILRWPGHVPAGRVENGIISGLDWFPTLVAAAGNPNISEELKKGKQLGDSKYKVHLDGYNQMQMITGKGPSARHEILYFTEGTLSAVRIDDFKYRFTDQPQGWLGGTNKVDWPILTNLRLDPYERTGMPSGANGSLGYYNWFITQFWRFQFVQKEVEKLAQTAIEFPPMQKGASFNLDAVKAQIRKRSRHSTLNEDTFESVSEPEGQARERSVQARFGRVYPKRARDLSLAAKIAWGVWALSFGAMMGAGFPEPAWVSPMMWITCTVGLLGFPMMLASWILSLRAGFKPAEVTVVSGRLVKDGEAIDVENAFAHRTPAGAWRVEASAKGVTYFVDALEEAEAKQIVHDLGFGAGGKRAQFVLTSPGRRFMNLFAAFLAYQIGSLFFGLAMGVAGVVARSSNAVMFTTGGFAMLGAMFVACYVLAKKLLAAPEVTVGLDGVSILKHGFRRTFVPLENLSAARQKTVGSPVLLELKSGGAIEVGGPVVDSLKRDAFAQHVRDLLHIKSTMQTPQIASLAREGRTIAAWRDHLRGVVEGGGYRIAAGGGTKETLDEIVAAPGTPVEERVGAALALRIANGADAIPRIRIAADACVDQTARTALEAIAAEELDDAKVERALRK